MTRRILRAELWASIGALLVAAGMPYLSAAMGWSATQEGNSIHMRPDVAAGVLIALVGFAILAIAAMGRGWTRLRRRRRRTARLLAG